MGDVGDDFNCEWMDQKKDRAQKCGERPRKELSPQKIDENAIEPMPKKMLEMVAERALPKEGVIGPKSKLS